jgi:hypothetical protein
MRTNGLFVLLLIVAGLENPRRKYSRKITAAHYAFDSADVCVMKGGLALGSGGDDGNTNKMRRLPNQRVRVC